MVETQRNNLKAKIIRQFDKDYAKHIQQGEDVKQEAVQIETMKPLESVTKRKPEINEQIEVMLSTLGRFEIVLARSIDIEIIQLKRTLTAIFERIDQIETIGIEGDPEGSICIAEGKGLKEGTVGGEEQFVLTTRNAQGRQPDRTENACSGCPFPVLFRRRVLS